MDMLVGILMDSLGSWRVWLRYMEGIEGSMLSEFCLEKELCVSITWSKREEKRKVTFRMGENKTEIHLVLIKKKQRSVKATTGEFQHALVIDDIYKKKIRKVVRKT